MSSICSGLVESNTPASIIRSYCSSDRRAMVLMADPYRKAKPVLCEDPIVSAPAALCARPLPLRSDLRLVLTEQQFHRFGDPAAVPVVLALGPVAVLVGDFQVEQQLTSALVMLAKIPVAGQNQSRAVAQLVGRRRQQPINAVFVEALLRAEDRRRAVLAQAVHHQRSVPGRGFRKRLGMPQQQAPGAPARLAEAEQVSAL